MVQFGNVKCSAMILCIFMLLLSLFFATQPNKIDAVVITTLPENRWGFDWDDTNGVTHKLDSISKKVAYQFTLTKNELLQAIHIYQYDVTGTPGTINVKLTTDLSETDILWSGQYSPVNYGDLKWVRLPASANLAPLVYYLVLSPEIADSANYCIFKGVQTIQKTENERWFDEGNPNPTRGFYTYEQGNWADRAAEPMYILERVDGSRFGQPYAASYIRPIGRNSDYEVKQAERFYLPAPITINGFGSLVSKKGTPMDNLYGVLQKVSDGTIMARAVLASPSDLPSYSSSWDLTKNAKWVFETFPDVTIPSGYYRFYLESPNSHGAYHSASQSNNCYFMQQAITSSSNGDVTWQTDTNAFYVEGIFYTSGSVYWGEEHYVDHPFFLSLVPETPTEEGTLIVNAFLGSGSVSAQVIVSGIGTFTAPVNTRLSVGTYSITVTYTDQTQQFSLSVQQDTTTTVIVRFAEISTS